MSLLRALAVTCGFFLLGTAPALASAGADGQFVLDKPAVVSGEPCWLTFRFTNHDTKAVHFYEAVGRGSVLMSGYSITASDTVGRQVSPPTTLMIVSGMVRDISVAPGAAYQRRLFLPDWFTLNKPGTYTLICKRPLSSAATVQSDIRLTILPPDSKALGLVIQKLGEQTRSGNPAAQDEATLSLSIIPDPRIVSPLAALLVRPSSSVRLSDADQFLLEDSKFSAIAGLSRFPSDESARALLPVLQQNDEDLRRTAGEALRQMKYADRVLPALKIEMRSQSASLRVMAIEAVVALQDSRGFGLLVNALHDRAPAVRYEAAKALGTLRDRRAEPVLRARLKDSDLILRLACIKSLVPLKYPVLPEWLIPIVRSYASPGHEYPSLEAMLILRRDCGDPAALAKCLRFDDPRPSHSYNFFLIYHLEACEGNFKYYYKWTNGSDTPAGLENNRRILAAIKREFPAR